MITMATIVSLIVLLLLALNVILAPFNPYAGKNNPFECGFLSFLWQNRVQFSIAFFLFALLFLLFDLEVLLVFPYFVSAYTNQIYGLISMVLFLLVLVAGFAFEYGRKALVINSKQLQVTSTHINKNQKKSYVNISNAKLMIMNTNKNKNQKKSYVNCNAILRLTNLTWIIFYTAILLFTLDIKVKYVCYDLLSFYTGCFAITFLCCCIVYSIIHSLAKPIFWRDSRISIFLYVFGTLVGILIIIILIAIFMISVLHLKANKLLLVYTIATICLILEWMIIIISCGCTFVSIGAVLYYIIKLLPISYIIKVNYIKIIIKLKLVNLLTKFKLYSKLIELKKITCYNIVKISKKFVKLEKKTYNKFKRIFRKVKRPIKIFIKNITAIIIKNIVYYFLLLISILATREFWNMMKEFRKINFIIKVFTGFDLFSTFLAISSGLDNIYSIFNTPSSVLPGDISYNADMNNNNFYDTHHPEILNFDQFLENTKIEGDITRRKEQLEYIKENYRLQNWSPDGTTIEYTHLDEQIGALQTKIDNISYINSRAYQSSTGSWLGMLTGTNPGYKKQSITLVLKGINDLDIPISTKVKYWKKNVIVQEVIRELEKVGTGPSMSPLMRKALKRYGSDFQDVAQRQYTQTCINSMINDDQVLNLLVQHTELGSGSTRTNQTIIRKIVTGLCGKAINIKSKEINPGTPLVVPDVDINITVPDRQMWNRCIPVQRGIGKKGFPIGASPENPFNLSEISTSRNPSDSDMTDVD